MSDGPGSLNLSDALADLAGSRLLLASDFDGTLARIVDDPAQARPDPRALTALKTLADAPATVVAIVSGRRRDELASLLGHMPGVLLVGEHGSDSGGKPEASPAIVEKILEQVEAIAAGFPGTTVEAKHFSVAFHYRRAPGDVEEALSRLRRGPGRLPGVRLSEGKKVLEIHATGLTKGDAVARLRESAGADALVFIGDDVTDETVFQQLVPPDIGIKVGEGPSEAAYRVPDVDAVVEVLEELIALLA